MMGYLDILREKYRSEPETTGYFNHLMQSAETIEKQISFARLYQDLGMQAPVWHRAQDVAERAAGSGGFGSIRFEIGTGTLELFADPLFEKVFSNLFENALRHGGVTGIRVSFSPDGEGGVLVVEDDGTGIPAPDKERIFERGVVNNPGLGLFLVKEILAITGLAIRETGEPGRGARFEIRIPKGALRYGTV